MTAEFSMLSLGWGRQSFAIAAMMALDELPRCDFLVHADTTHEISATYDFARRWTPWLGEHGLTVVTVQEGRTEVVREDWSKAVLIPAFTTDRDSGSEGQIRRQCTGDWKIGPLRRFARGELERRGVRLRPGVVESWQGISIDEIHRMRDSEVKYITHVYPLIDRRISRVNCAGWLQDHGLEVPPKSSCTFCPYQSKARWAGLKKKGGSDWAEALEIDGAIRSKRPKADLFIHPNRAPLDQAVYIPEDDGVSQAELDFEDSPCDSGYCHT